MIKIAIFSYVLAAALPLQASALGLEEAVGEGLRASSDLELMRAKKEEAGALLGEAKNNRLPRLAVKSAYTRGDEPVYAFASAMKQGTFSMASMAAINDPEPASNYQASLEAGIPLFTGFAISRGIEMREAGARALDAASARAEAGVRFSVVHQWLTALLRRHLLDTVEEAVADSEKELEAADSLREKGMVLGSDYYAAEAILAGLKAYRSQWRRAYALERERLNIMLGRPKDTPFEPAGRLEEADFKVGPQNDYLSGALARRADLKAAGEAEKAAAAWASLQKNSILPVVEAFGVLETNSERLSAFSSSNLYGVRLTLPLGDPGYSARSRAASARLDQQRAGTAGLRRQTAGEVASAWQNYMGAVESARDAALTHEKARKSLDLFRPLYRQGRQSVMEVLRAERAVLEAKAAWYENLFKINLFYAQLRLASETLDTSAVGEIASATAAD
ncbi:MAG: tolC [Elusimicrobia bacterium]|nr:MAG: tolC [Elusimicrobiota bacterium]KAF0156021.1 MAG: tolC [Elusimicrobiota bacterium]